VKAVEKNDEVDTIDMPMDPKTSDTNTIDEDGDELFPAQTSQALDDSHYRLIQRVMCGFKLTQVHSAMYYLLYNTKELLEMTV